MPEAVPDWNSRQFHGTYNKYPFTDVVSFVLRRFGHVARREAIRVMDIGCGGGAHMVFLANEGFDAYGIDGNEDGVIRCNARLMEAGHRGDRAITGTFDRMPFPDRHFDALIDRGSITCNRKADIPAVLQEAARVLKPSGCIFSMMLDALGASAAGGRHVVDGDYVDFDGRLEGAGLLHFTTSVEAADLFSPFFIIESIERTVTYVDFPVGGAAVRDGWIIMTARTRTE